ncbi:MAG: flagellar motor protein MotB [Gammaproteobacteria bacterium]|nr:flagellar motor protein MotB [Gammaproteobacteria bacterium]
MTRISGDLAELRASNTELRDKNEQLQNENKQLSGMIEGLKRDLQQERSVVEEKEDTISQLDMTRREIEASLKQQIAQKDIKIEEIEGKLKVTFVDKILFDSGSTKIKDKGKEVLLTLAESFASATDRKVVVEGHTDDVPLGEVLRTKFPSNWELSTARSASVVRFLQEQANIEPERLTATGYSFYQPIASNESEETRKQNRRIEIILVPRQ